MNYLAVLSLISFLGSMFMLFKKVQEVAPHAESVGSEAHTNFIFDFFRTLVHRTKEVATNAYLAIRPQIHDLMSTAASKMYKLSSWSAKECLKLHDFIQGRKVLKNTGNTSIFIRDITRSKEDGRSARQI